MITALIVGEEEASPVKIDRYYYFLERRRGVAALLARLTGRSGGMLLEVHPLNRTQREQLLQRLLNSGVGVSRVTKLCITEHYKSGKERKTQGGRFTITDSHDDAVIERRVAQILNDFYNEVE